MNTSYDGAKILAHADEKDLASLRAENERLREVMAKIQHCPSCESTHYSTYPATYVCADCGVGWCESEE